MVHSPDSRIDLPIHRHALDNGLRLVVHPDRSLPLVALNLWYHVGSKDERPGRTGLAHLFEHMLFQGSAHVAANDHFRYVQQVGGVVNGSTWYDRTNYYETLPSNRLALGLWLESDRMGHFLPALTPEKLETQREVVSNERRQRIDNQPYGRAFERLHELLYPADHPYHWPVIGYMDDIAAATMEDVKGFFRRHYAPGNAVLSLAGDLDVDDAVRAVERWFGEIPAGRPKSEVQAPNGSTRSAARERLVDEVGLARVYIGHRVPAYGERAWYAADLLTTHLAGGRSSPLYHDLVYDRQIARDVSAFVFPTELEATLCLVATGRPGIGAGELAEALEGSLAKAARDPAPAADLERARNRLLTSYFTELQNLDHRADLLSQMTVHFDEPERVRSEAHHYVGLEAEDLMELATTHLGPDRRCVVEVVPAEAAT